MGKIQDLTDVMTQSPGWFALYTRHRHEKTVARLVSEKGVEVFLPLYRAAHRWNDRIKELTLPLFPNYVFVLMRPGHRGIVLSTPGVYDFVRMCGIPAPVSAGEIDAVRRVVDEGLNAEPHPFLKSGDRVRVKFGPLEGLEGILVRKKKNYRLVISVELLVKSVSVEVDVADVERIESRTSRTILSPQALPVNISV